MTSARPRGQRNVGHGEHPAGLQRVKSALQKERTSLETVGGIQRHDLVVGTTQRLFCATFTKVQVIIRVQTSRLYFPSRYVDRIDMRRGKLSSPKKVLRSRSAGNIQHAVARLKVRGLTQATRQGGASARKIGRRPKP